MHNQGRNLIIPTYDTEVLEKALEEACNGNIQIRHRLEIRNLATSLWYDVELKKQGITNQSHVEPIKALTNFKANLQRRKKTSDLLTSSRLMEVPEPAHAILLSDIANTFRDEIDDYTQIDFGNDKHVELLKAAVDSSISKVANKQGRPVNEALDEFFIGLKDLYEAATGKTAIAEGHYSNQPKTDFEKLIYLGYQIIRPAQEYEAAYKAYERAISRNS
jgi:hypothetical protein